MHLPATVKNDRGPCGELDKIITGMTFDDDTFDINHTGPATQRSMMSETERKS